MDLFAAVARGCGMESGPGSALAALDRSLGNSRRILMVLVDGLGMEILERVRPPRFFGSAEIRELRAVFPSTTATVLSSLATLTWPAEHGVTGWFTRLPNLRRTVLPLRQLVADTGEPLSDLGIGPADVVRAAPVQSEFRIPARTLLPKHYVRDPYSRWARSDAKGVGYRSTRHAFRRITRLLRFIPGRLFLYAYVPIVDALSHRNGPDSDVVAATVMDVDRYLARLADRLDEGTRLLVTADHGQVYVPVQSRYVLRPGDRLLGSMECPPSGEPAVPVFHVREGMEEEFRDALAEHCNGAFALLTPSEIEDLRLYGPDPLAVETRRRLGTYIGISPEPVSLEYIPEGGTPRSYPGVHGGLRPAEMRVPLAIV
jgi:hypothetical protein